MLDIGVAARAGQEEGREARDHLLLLGRVWAPEECDGNSISYLHGGNFLRK